MKKFTLIFIAAILTSSFAFAQAAFWTENFAGGIPAGWVNGGTDAGGSSVSGMWKYTTVGSNGLYSGGIKLHSPTESNGYAIFDSDSLDSGGLTGAIGTGPAIAPQRGYLTTTAINCTGHSQVYLEFYQYFLNFQAATRVVVSNGTTSDTIEVNSHIESAGLTYYRS